MTNSDPELKTILRLQAGDTLHKGFNGVEHYWYLKQTGFKQRIEVATAVVDSLIEKYYVVVSTDEEGLISATLTTKGWLVSSKPAENTRKKLEDSLTRTLQRERAQQTADSELIKAIRNLLRTSQVVCEDRQRTIDKLTTQLKVTGDRHLRYYSTTTNTGHAPPVVVLLGSRKVHHLMLDIQSKLTIKGKIVLWLNIITPPSNISAEEFKHQLCDLRREQLDLAVCTYSRGSYALVVTEDGIVGVDTQELINYAQYIKLPVKYFNASVHDSV